MKALTWQGKRDVRVEEVPDPRIEEPTDAIVRITSTAICGSDLHLYEVLGPYLKPGDVLGHEPMGIVEEVGSGVTRLKPGDRVVVPFNISCGSCWMCQRQLYAQCETTRHIEEGRLDLRLQLPYARCGRAGETSVPAPVRPIRCPGGNRRRWLISAILPNRLAGGKYADTPAAAPCRVRLGPASARAARRHPGADRDRPPVRSGWRGRRTAARCSTSQVDDVPKR